MQPNRRQLLHEFRSRTSTPPPADASRVWLKGHACGWAKPEAAAVVGLREGRASLPETDDGLAGLARRLHEAGVLSGWRNELLDVMGDDGRVLGRIERATMRPLGLMTRAVHLTAYAPDGRLWVARRALHKNTDPGMWDTLVGGLIAAGESPALALERESDEEAGLTPAHLRDAQPIGDFLVTRRVPEGYQREHVLVTDCVLPPDCTPCNRDGEVEEIRLAPAEEVLAGIADHQYTAEASLAILISLEAAARPG
ncbi:NUDIX domain-containing protein [Verticiella sediminum]|uniref:NUDIX domain-containing protein n=1 Tax=Verticiella sediminum TaxID=1247510 RepID=A0A556AKB9_9BURK|nr:NUDIX domain-containing protein [Verticiella sediminum]TSH93338.1 NUDIX domain-containing protein [Verticiella sediminum]